MVSLSKVLLGVLAVLSYKTVPLAYVTRFYVNYYRYVLGHRSKYVKSKTNTYNYTVEKKGPLAAFEPVTYSTYVSPLEYDMFLHKSNSTYFVDLDFARLKLLCIVLQKGFLSYVENEHKDFKLKSIFNNLHIPVASVECSFKKELKMFEKYDVISKIGGWNEKWLFVVSKFVKHKDQRIVAIAVTKYVFKKGRITVPPATIMERSGLLTKEAEAENEKNIKLFDHFANTEVIEEYVTQF